ncbi:fumarylacetoacetate hydrolase [Nocardioides sp. CF8]|nr:fumarylacetoacetate hydrolase [Nocardioides sp. CF8]
MGEHLGGGPVHRGVRRTRDDRLVEHDLHVDVEAGPLTDREVVERLGVLAGQVGPRRLEGGQRGHPVADRGGEGLAEERSERDVLPGLDVARRPVVEPDDAEGVVREVGDADPLAEVRRRAHDEAELGLDVEPGRRAVGGAWRRTVG